MPTWAIEILKASPVVGGCLFVAWILVKAGWLHVRIGNRKAVPIPKPAHSDPPRQESGRHEAVRIRDLFDEHEIDPPGFWVDENDKRIEHKLSNALQARVMKEIDSNSGRISRMEPELTALRIETRENHDDIVEMRATMAGFRESQADIRKAIKDMRDEVMETLDRRSRRAEH